LSGCLRCCGRSEGVAVEADIVEGAGEGREGWMKPPAESVEVIVEVSMAV
jgi:hypothetical protein